MNTVFKKTYNLKVHEVKLAKGVAGIYFIFLKDIPIIYPFIASRLIYIGMSESRQNSISKRLQGHLTGQSGNLGISNYAKSHNVGFAFYSADVLKNLGSENVFDLESFFLSDFMETHGTYPICNGQAGHQLSEAGLNLSAKIDWPFFQ